MRIAIVNDTIIAREALRRTIGTLPEHSIAWVACDGAEAIQRCAQDRPDLILMDLIMPVVDGVEATRRIMAKSPCPILVVTATVEGNAAKVLDALGAGALDAVKIPGLSGSGNLEGTAALKLKIQSIRRLVSRSSGLKDSRGPDIQPASSAAVPLVVIGASAGGPAALATIVRDLPRNFSAGVAIVQHIDAEFASSMAAWLQQDCRLPVRVARDRERPEPGAILVAATNNHLVCLDSRTLGYVEEPRDCNYKPSIDVFFESVASRWRGSVAGALLTGMGRDGATGLKSLRDAGALTIAQDAKTSVVYGMPKAAAELNAAVEVLPLERIAFRLVNWQLFSSQRTTNNG